MTPEPPDKASSAERGQSISSIRVELLGNEEIQGPKEIEKIKELEAKGKANGVSKREVARHNAPKTQTETRSKGGTNEGGKVGKREESKANGPNTKAQAEKKGPTSKPGTKSPSDKPAAVTAGVARNNAAGSQSNSAHRSTTTGTQPPPPSYETAITMVPTEKGVTAVSYKPLPSPTRRNTTANARRPAPPPLSKTTSLDTTTSSGGPTKPSESSEPSRSKASGRTDLPFKPITQKTTESSKASKPAGSTGRPGVGTKPGDSSKSGPGARRTFSGAASDTRAVESPDSGGKTSNVKSAAGKPTASGGPVKVKTVHVTPVSTPVSTPSQEKREAGQTKPKKGLKTSQSLPHQQPMRQDSAPSTSTATPPAGTTVSPIQSLPVVGAGARRPAPAPPAKLPPLQQQDSQPGRTVGGVKKQGGGGNGDRQPKPPVTGQRRVPPQKPLANGTTTQKK